MHFFVAPLVGECGNLSLFLVKERIVDLTQSNILRTIDFDVLYGRLYDTRIEKLCVDSVQFK